ncbi:MAG: 2-amino-4-hydroxy-6-hydroxymethyldihydropteridine diphosphokinase [Acidobacteria bacterium]|nr:2-amino-4-hydroxy-6-hydroxymethyldihydropteridine diphosphokinase [Acidobacteriota bacterium]
MSVMWLGLGANLGEPAEALRWAIRRLGDEGVVVEAVSSLYASAPQGVEDQPEFTNAACRVRTDLDPPAVLALAKELEAEAGRVDGPRWGPRPLDIDILAWDGGTWDDPDLVIPHPRLHERRFALQPLVEVDPDLALPSGERIDALLAAIPSDEQPVARLADA